MSKIDSLGLGVLIGLLGGNKESVEAFASCIGKRIDTVELLNNELLFSFVDGTRMKLYDDGQSCCEHRYMHTDDDLSYFSGSELLDAEIRDAPDIEEEYDVHEVQFLLVTTSKGVFTMESHNEHNGYYGGFLIRAAIIN